MNTEKSKTITKEKVLVANDLFLDPSATENRTLVRHMDAMRSKAKEIAAIYDEKQQRNAVKWTDARKKKMLRRFKLLRAIFSKAQSAIDIKNNIDEKNAIVKACKESNLNAIYTHTKPYEKAAKALDLLHINRGHSGRVILFPVDKKRFAEPGNNFMLKRDMKNLLEKEFYRFELTQSPLYITYLGEIEDPIILRQIAEIACTTKALAILDTPMHEQVSDFLDFAEEFSITGIEEMLGHLVLPSTHVKIGDVKDYEIKEVEGKYVRLKEKNLAVPGAGGFVGSLLAAKPGESIAGIHRRGIAGGTGVIMEYNLERKDATAIAQKGFVMLGYINNSVRILGTRTGNVSDKEELHQFPKVDIRNTIAKALIQFSNDETFGDWGAEEEELFIEKVKNYLNERVPKVIVDYSLERDDVRYNSITKKVEIKLSIKYKDVQEGFVFSLEGSPGDVKIQN